MNRVVAVGVVAIMVVVSGCTTRYWARDIKYEGLQRDIPQRQTLHITSIPQASLEVDGTNVGMTPRDVTLDYSVIRVRAAKYKYESSPGNPPRQIGAERHDETVAQTTPHLLRLEAKGYYPLYKAISVPLDSTKLDFVLQKAGVSIPQVKCNLIIEARKEYFEKIERIIKDGNNALGLKFEPKFEDLKQIAGLNVFQQEYSNQTMKDAVQFDKLVNELQAMAKKEQYVFKIVSAEFTGEFTTNVMGAGIEHVVAGQTRPAARLFLMKDGQPDPIASVATDGSFRLVVKLAPQEEYVFLISKYRQELKVFIRVNVYSQQQEEISEEDFYKEAQRRGWHIDAKMIDAL